MLPSAVELELCGVEVDSSGSSGTGKADAAKLFSGSCPAIRSARRSVEPNKASNRLISGSSEADMARA